MKCILSIGPHTSKQEGVFQIDFDDGKITPYILPPPPPKVEFVELSIEESQHFAEDKEKADFLRCSATSSAAEHCHFLLHSAWLVWLDIKLCGVWRLLCIRQYVVVCL
jgi:hypothetical protein